MIKRINKFYFPSNSIRSDLDHTNSEIRSVTRILYQSLSLMLDTNNNILGISSNIMET